MKQDNAFITGYNYLSINKNYLNTTSDVTVTVNNKVYDIEALKNNITYSDNRNFYRWDVPSYNRCLAV